jgi:hypothetical protein
MSQPSERSAQDPLSRRQNEDFFRGNDTYARNVTRLETYMNISAAVSNAIAGARRLLDVGNGGVFVYNTTLATEIVGVDLFLGDHAPSATPANVVLRQGDAWRCRSPTRATTSSSTTRSSTTWSAATSTRRSPTSGSRSAKHDGCWSPAGSSS